MNKITPFLVKDAKKIHLYLGMILAGRCIISAVFGRVGRESFLTAILGIDEGKQRVLIDCSSKETLNNSIFNSQVIRFSTELNGISISFEGTDIMREGSLETPSFSIEIPRSIYWLQRRDYYRVKALLSQKISCKIIIPRLKLSQKLLIELPVYDLSANGFSLLNNSDQFSKFLQPFESFEQCELLLNEKIILSVSIEIKSNALISALGSHREEKVGCLITKPSIRVENILAKYIQRIEREARKRERDVL